jgi:predicted RNase H-like nuclease
MANDTVSPEQARRAAFVKGLRKLAELYAGNNDLPLPTTPFEIAIYPHDSKEAIGQIAKILAPFKATKEASEVFFTVKADLNEVVRVAAYVYRNAVCERRQVGTKEVRRQVAVTTREEVVQEPVYEWTCPDSLLASAK